MGYFRRDNAVWPPENTGEQGRHLRRQKLKQPPTLGDGKNKWQLMRNRRVKMTALLGPIK